MDSLFLVSLDFSRNVAVLTRAVEVDSRLDPDNKVHQLHLTMSRGNNRFTLDALREQLVDLEDRLDAHPRGPLWTLISQGLTVDRARLTLVASSLG